MHTLFDAGSIAGFAYLIQVMQANPDGTKAPWRLGRSQPHNSAQPTPTIDLNCPAITSIGLGLLGNGPGHDDTNTNG